MDAAGERRRGGQPGGASTACARTASGCAVARYPDERFVRRVHGRRARRPALPRARSTTSRRARRSSTASCRGTRSRSRRAPGIVHIATGCGGEDFELGRSLGLPVLTPVDEAGPLLRRLRLAARPLDGRGGRPDRRPARRDAASSSRPGVYEHSYPHCWRCDTPLIWRISDDWFIGVDGVREQLLEANATVEWVPAYMGKRMDDWLRNMGDWNISRRRYYGLPLPFYPCSCGHLNVIGSKEELRERARRGLRPARRSCAGRGSTACRSRARRAASAVDARGRGRRRLARRRHRPVLDARLAEPGVGRAAATARAPRRASRRADLPDHAYWEKWFPADWVTEMREQIRLWFYSQLFMSVVLVGRAPFKRVLGYEKMLDEHGREMHGSWGNMIDAEDAFARMGADVMRWQYCAQPPDRDLLFGFGPAHEIKRKLLTLWNSVGFLVTVREHRRASSRRSPTSRPGRRWSGRSTAGSSSARTSSCTRRPPGTRRR